MERAYYVWRANLLYIYITFFAYCMPVTTFHVFLSHLLTTPLFTCLLPAIPTACMCHVYMYMLLYVLCMLVCAVCVPVWLWAVFSISVPLISYLSISSPLSLSPCTAAVWPFKTCL